MAPVGITGGNDILVTKLFNYGEIDDEMFALSINYTDDGGKGSTLRIGAYDNA